MYRSIVKYSCEKITIFLLTSCTFMFVWFFITETKHVISCFELIIVSYTQQISDIKKVNVLELFKTQ
jgi:hypothetical protein